MQNTVKKPELSTPSEVVSKTEGQEAIVGVEATPIAETTSTTAAPADITQDDAGAASVKAVKLELEKTVTKEEVEDLTSSDIEDADVDWIGRVKDVIREDHGKPFEEEADAESLNEEYMMERFKVDVDAPVEEK